jgi:hypothetical protein
MSFPSQFQLSPTVVILTIRSMRIFYFSNLPSQLRPRPYSRVTFPRATGATPFVIQSGIGCPSR